MMNWPAESVMKNASMATVTATMKLKRRGFSGLGGKCESFHREL